MHPLFKIEDGNQGHTNFIEGKGLGQENDPGIANEGLHLLVEHIPGHENYPGELSGPCPGQPFVQVPAVEPGHFPVGQDQVICLFFYFLKGGFPVEGGIDQEAVAFQHVFDEGQDLFFVIHNQHPGFA